MNRTISAGVYLSSSVLLMILLTNIVFAQTKGETSGKIENMVEKTQNLINQIIDKSYPELDKKKVRIKLFQSRQTFFKAQFSFTRYLTFQSMGTTIFVNPLVFERNAPEEGIRAILSHELAHALYYNRKNRLELIGLIGLMSDGFTANFERKTDLVAIERGYGEGLILYRNWLYQNVPEDNITEKKRNYFSPEEIKLLIPVIENKPGIGKSFKKDVPRNLVEVKEAIRKIS